MQLQWEKHCGLNFYNTNGARHKALLHFFNSELHESEPTQPCAADGVFRMEGLLIENTDNPVPTADKPLTTADKPPIKIKPRKEKILNYIKENGSINNSELCELLEIKASRAKELLRQMAQRGLIQSVGENKNRRYVLPKE